MSALLTTLLTPDTLPGYLPASALASRTVTGNDSLQAADRVVFLDATGGSLTFTLPAPGAAFLGLAYWLKRVDSSGNAVLLAGTDSEITSLNDVSGGNFTTPSGVAMGTDGTTWWVLARG